MRWLLCLLVLGLRLAAADFTVHEWGTFTSVVGSDGKALSGLEVEEDALPLFVKSISGIPPFNKGFDRPLKGVTIKMETPVLYFYSNEPLTARVAVKFHGGSISQWYPERSDVEVLPEPAFPKSTAPALDFSNGHEGFAAWKVDVLPRSSTEKLSAPKEQETPQWPRARLAEANRLRGSKGEVEDFIFYRGLGHFDLPLQVTAAKDGTLTLANRGVHPLPFVWAFRKDEGDTPSSSWTCSLAPGETRKSEILTRHNVSFAEALMSAGLSKEEAKALTATWRESYFERPGLRVFWIVPREITDAILPPRNHPSARPFGTSAGRSNGSVNARV